VVVEVFPYVEGASSVFCWARPYQLLGEDRWATHIDARNVGVTDVGMTRVVSIPAVVVLPAPLAEQPEKFPGAH